MLNLVCLDNGTTIVNRTVKPSRQARKRCTSRLIHALFVKNCYALEREHRDAQPAVVPNCIKFDEHAAAWHIGLN